MKSMKIRWSLAGAMALALGMTVAAGNARAAEPEEEGELTVNMEFMYMESYGDDVHVLTIKTEENNVGPDSNDISKNTAHEIDQDEDFGFRGDLAWRRGKWGAGISGFHFDNEGDLDKRGTPDDFRLAEEELSFQYAWGGPECNSDDICSFTMDSDQEIWMIDLYGIRELVKTPDAGIELQFGLRLAEYEMNLDGIAGEIDENEDPLEWESDETRLMKMSSDSDTLVGPFLSILTHGRYGRFRVEGQFSQSVLFGDFEGKSRGIAIDSGALVSGFDSDDFYDINSVRSNRDVSIPVSDLRLKIGYDILDNVTLGFGAYTTVWWDTPLPPRSGPEDRIGNLSGPHEETLTFVGASFSLEMRFGGGGGFSLPDFSSFLP